MITPLGESLYHIKSAFDDMALILLGDGVEDRKLGLKCGVMSSIWVIAEGVGDDEKCWE